MFSDRIKKLTPYVPGEQPQDRTYVKLNTNENPYPPSPGIREFLQSTDHGELRLYPDPLAKRLREKLGERYHLPCESVFVGNGSDEVLSFTFFSFFDSAYGKLLFPEFTYSFFPVFCNYYRIEYEKIPLDADFGIDLDRFLKSSPTCGIIFPNPNAPTGMYKELSEIESLLKRWDKDKVIVVDEAYIDFGGESAASLVPCYPNLLVIGTFSKSRSLAGIRLGYALGHEQLIKALFTAKDSFNSYPLDRLAQKIGEISLDDESYNNGINKRIITTRENFSRELKALGFDILPSKANFVFARKPGVEGKALYLALKEQGILVRHFNIKGIDDFIRVTIGTDEQMKSFIEKVKTGF